MGKVSICYDQVKPMLLLITEKLREILTYQCCFQRQHVGVCLVLFRISSNRTQRVCLEKKAVPARPPDVNFAFCPEDNPHLIVHECGLEPGDAQGLRAVRDFILNRTDSSCVAPERLRAIW